MLRSSGKSAGSFRPLLRRRRDHAENEQPPRVGKPACRTFEADFLSKIKAVRTYVCDGYVISGNKAFIVYRIDADHAEWGTLNMSEVAIQEWSNGKVVREKFVY